MFYCILTKPWQQIYENLVHDNKGDKQWTSDIYGETKNIHAMGKI